MGRRMESKMKNFLQRWFMMLAATVCVQGVSADVLYWMVDTSNRIEFEYAVVYAAQTDDLVGREWTAESGFGVDAIALPKNVPGGEAYDSKNGYGTTGTSTWDIKTQLGSDDWYPYSFYVELLQWDSVNGVELRMGVSQVATYQELLISHHLIGSDMWIPANVSVWAPSFSSVPEPTSGVLLILGCAAMLLRRRTAVTRSERKVNLGG